MSSTDTDTVAPPAAPPRPARRRLTRRTKIATTLLAILFLLESGALTTRYFLTDHRWVIVDNAQVAGNRVEIRAPVDGRVVDWNIDSGSVIGPDQNVGRIEILGTGIRPRRPVRSPGRGTVANNSVSVGTYVTAGELLATAYDLGGVYVTARVPEKEMHDVHLGNSVDVLSDAYSGTPLTGTVAAIAGAAAGVNELSGRPDADPTNLDFPIYPGPDTDSQNPQGVDQYIPVRIQLGPTDNARLTPGQNVTVHIHRH